MAICETCQREMTTADSCLERDNALRFGAELLNMPAEIEAQWDPELLRVKPGERCGDCAVAVGGIHHLNCLIERCPVCHDQAVFCFHDQPRWRQVWWRFLCLIRWPA